MCPTGGPFLLPSRSRFRNSTFLASFRGNAEQRAQKGIFQGMETLSLLHDPSKILKQVAGAAREREFAPPYMQNGSFLTLSIQLMHPLKTALQVFGCWTAHRYVSIVFCSFSWMLERPLRMRRHGGRRNKKETRRKKRRRARKREKRRLRSHLCSMRPFERHQSSRLHLNDSTGSECTNAGGMGNQLV